MARVRYSEKTTKIWKHLPVDLYFKWQCRLIFESKFWKNFKVNNHHSGVTYGCTGKYLTVEKFFFQSLPRHFFIVLTTPNSTKSKISTSPSNLAARKRQIQPFPPLVLAFKKGLQNHIKCCVPRKSLKFEKWFKGIKYSVSKVFSLAKLIFWISAIFVE